MVPGSRAVFRRCSSTSADTRRKSAFLIKGQSLLKPNVIDVRVDSLTGGSLSQTILKPNEVNHEK